MPGGSTVGNSVLSFFPRGPLATSREVSRYSHDLTPMTNAFSLGVEQKLIARLLASPPPTCTGARHDLYPPHRQPVPAAPGSPNFGRTTDGGPAHQPGHLRGPHRLRRRGRGPGASASRHRYSFARVVHVLAEQGQSAHGRRGIDVQQQQRPRGGLRSLEPIGAPRLRGRERPRGPALGLRRPPASTPGAAALAFSPAGCRTSTATASSTSATPPRRATGFRTKAYSSLDARLEKTIQDRRTPALSALVEGFNLLNRANVKNISNVAGAEFGTPTEYFPGREIQLGLRWMFGR